MGDESLTKLSAMTISADDNGKIPKVVENNNVTTVVAKDDNPCHNAVSQICEKAAVRSGGGGSGGEPTSLEQSKYKSSNTSKESSSAEKGGQEVVIENDVGLEPPPTIITTGLATDSILFCYLLQSWIVVKSAFICKHTIELCISCF